MCPLSTTIAFDVPGLSPWDVASGGREVSVRISGLQGDGDVVEWTTRYLACP